MLARVYDNIGITNSSPNLCIPGPDFGWVLRSHRGRLVVLLAAMGFEKSADYLRGCEAYATQRKNLNLGLQQGSTGRGRGARPAGSARMGLV